MGVMATTVDVKIKNQMIIDCYLLSRSVDVHCHGNFCPAWGAEGGQCIINDNEKEQPFLCNSMVEEPFLDYFLVLCGHDV